MSPRCVFSLLTNDCNEIFFYRAYHFDRNMNATVRMRARGHDNYDENRPLRVKFTHLVAEKDIVQKSNPTVSFSLVPQASPFVNATAQSFQVPLGTRHNGHQLGASS